MFLIFSAFPNHAWINIGDSFHFTNSHVFPRQQTCHQWNPEHYILCIWNCYIVAVYVWCQVYTFFCCNFWIVSKGKRSWSNGDSVKTILKTAGGLIHWNLVHSFKARDCHLCGASMVVEVPLSSFSFVYAIMTRFEWKLLVLWILWRKVFQLKEKLWSVIDNVQNQW